MSPEEVFQRFVPEAAITYCVQLYAAHNFVFKIKKSRQSKLGDYRFDHRLGQQTITINNDLNPYAFLITYLHEVAHLTAFERFGRRIRPHGKEWQNEFKELAQPVLSEEVFPPYVLQALRQYFSKPKAASCSDPLLHETFRKFDGAPITFLKDLSSGDVFEFRGQSYKKIETKRTRSICCQLETGKRYLIPEMAEVSCL